MELTKSQLITLQQALGYAVMYAKTEHETAEFALTHHFGDFLKALNQHYN